MKKDEEKRKKYLFVLIFLTSILLATTSYAWFTASRLVTINMLNLHVAAEGGLEISADAVNWKSILEIDDLINSNINYQNNTNQIPNWLLPMSTGGDVLNGKLNLFKGQGTDAFGTGYLLTASKAIEKAGYGDDNDAGFVAFDIFLRTTTAKKIYLTTTAGVYYDGIESKGIENAFRIAFLKEGTLSKDSSLSAIQNMNNATNALIWEPNYDTHTESGVRNAMEVYGISTTKTGGSLLPYDGVINEITSSDNIKLSDANASNYPSYFKAVNVDYKTTTNFTQFVELFDLEKGVTKFRIYMWIEGQDVDCENDASIGDVIVNLQMSTNPS